MSHNQVSTVVLDDRVDKKQVKYLNKDFSDFKKSLIQFTQFYFADTYQDFSDASPGSIFIDMASYVGDVLSYYTDHSFRENLLAHAEQRENVISLAQGFGYKPKVVTPSFCSVSMSALIPSADVDGNIDTKFLPRFSAGTSFEATTDREVGSFITQDICDFGDDIGRDVRPFSIDASSGKPDSYVVSKVVKVISATERKFDVVVTSPTKFFKIQIPDENIVDIKSVVDAEGNTWHEVENLSQDYIFSDVLFNVTSSITPLYTLKTTKTNRRFITRLNRKLKTELVFGSGTGDLSDVYENPDYRSVYDDNYLQNMTNVALDTLNFTSGNSFGLAPANTTLTISYRVAGGLSSNVASGAINKISNLATANDVSALSTVDQGTFNTVLSSVTVVNDEAARGGGDAPTIEQIRHSAIGYINAQRRVVTASDYEKRVLSMPAKYGSVHRAFVVHDDAINNIQLQTQLMKDYGKSMDPEDDIRYVDDKPVNTNINLYVLGLDSNRRITTLNNSVKTNIKHFLKGYRLLTERINIIDAFRVSIGVKYSIIVYRGFTAADVLVRCSDKVRKYFDIDNWQINQPILIDDLLVQIASVNGVQAVTSLDVINKCQQNEGSDYAPYQYKLEDNTQSNIILPSADPCLFELRYPQKDIVGTAVQ